MSNQQTVGEFMEASDLVYFKPTEAFFEYFLKSEWKWRKFHDCGAGVGELTAAMRKRKLDCVAYDLHPRKISRVPVEAFNTASIDTRMDWSEVVLIARPCHHPEFIDVTIHSALEMGEAFYIGVPRNIGRDLVQFEYDVVAKDVGESGEVLIRIRCDIDKFHIRRKIKSPSLSGRDEWWWYRPATRRYVSEPTGLSGFGASGKEVVLEEQRWANDLQITETKADICKENSDYGGWIAPDGEWFGVAYAQHDYVARAVLGCSVKRLEELGFVRCRDGRAWEMGDAKRPTPKQKATMKAKGFDPKR